VIAQLLSAYPEAGNEKERVAWDVYFLYGPDATWDQLPGPLVGSGATVYEKSHALRAQVQALVRDEGVGVSPRGSEGRGAPQGR
jgi:hypothetical protein